MISSEVQRTLVKSPPELWTELSDPAALARHLGEFGEIRITHSLPEQLVEWESDRARGSVLLKPSGWGTKVTLTVTGELPPAEADRQPQPAAEPMSNPRHVPAPEPEAAAEPVPAAEPQPAAAEARHADASAMEAEAEPVPAPVTPAAIAAERIADDDVEVSFDPVAVPLEAAQESPSPIFPPEPLPEPRRGFFARLFGRGAEPAKAQLPEELPPPPVAEPIAESDEPEPEPASEALASEPLASEPPESVYQPAPAQEPEPIPPSEDAQEEPAEDLSAELKMAEETAAERVEVVLTSVLDRLGSAHHRPFSRS